MSRYRNYKDNGISKGILGGILGGLLIVGLVAGGIALHNSIEDNQTQEVENETNTGSETETVEVK